MRKLYLLFAGMLMSGMGKAQPALRLACWDDVSYVFPASKEPTVGKPLRACAAQGPVRQAIPLVGEGAIAAARGLHGAPVNAASARESAPAPASPLLLAVIAPPSSTAASSISISGIVSGGSGAVQVGWTTSSGASGVAQGSANWIIPAIPLSAGNNIVTIRAQDSLANVVSYRGMVSYQPASPGPSPPPGPNPAPKPPSGPDTTPPSLTILAPATTNYYTSAGSLAVNGTATDNVGVASVTWATSNGASGAASGTTTWSTPGIPLYVGSTTIVITAFDAAGNSSWRSLTVTRY